MPALASSDRVQEHLRTAWRALSANRLRAALTVLSLSVGVAAITALTSLAMSGLATLSRDIDEVGGTRFICLWNDDDKAQARLRDYFGGLTYGDVQAIRAEIPHVQDVTADRRRRDASLKVPGQDERLDDVVAEDPHFLSVFGLHLLAGRNLSPEDLAQRRRVCLLGEVPAHELFGAKSPIGQRLDVAGVSHEVVGVIANPHREHNGYGYSWSHLAVVPFTTATSGVADPRVNMIALKVDDHAHSEEVMRRLNQLLISRHHGVADFTLLDFGQMLKNFYLTFLIMEVVVALIASMALLIGGVGVMNIMLVSVAQRVREIGLRKALGASEGDVLGQFLAEAALLSAAGGLLGCASGLAISVGSAPVIRMVNPQWVGVTSYPAAVLGVLASAAVGLFFGWYPARRAARLDPVVALRS